MPWYPAVLTVAITHSRVDPVAVRQWSVECDTGTKRLDWLIARMGKGSCRLEADACPAIAEGEIGRMMKSQGSCQIQTRARRDHPFTRHMRFGEARCNVDGGAVRPLAAYGSDGNGFLACRRADVDFVARGETLRAAYVDPGRSGARRR